MVRSLAHFFGFGWVVFVLFGCGGGGGTSLSTDLIMVVGSRNGQVLVGSGSAQLTVIVTNRGGTALSGVPVTLLAPGSGASGAFTNPGAGGPNIFQTQTDANGKATATFTANGQSGVYLVDAFINGTPTLTTFAITNLPAAVAPALAPDVARTAVKQQLMGNAPEDELTRLHGPVLLPAGTQIVADGPNTPEVPVVPYTTTAAQSWFFWLDGDPTAGFTHPTRFVTIDAADASAGFTSRAHISQEGWWPRITIPGGAADGVSLVPAVLRDDTSSVRSIHRLARSVSTRAPSDACAIFIHGPRGGKACKQDVDNFRTFLINSGRVSADNCLPAADDPFRDKPTTPGEVSTWIRQAKDKGCKKLYIFSSSHGANGSFELAKNLSDDSPPQAMTYQDVADKLKGTDWELCMYFWGCQSGTALTPFLAPGFKGLIVTSASFGHASYFGADYEFTYFGTAFLACWQDRDANGPNKGSASMNEAFQWTLSHAGEGDKDPKTFKMYTLKGNPSSDKIGSYYTASPDAIKLVAGTNGTVTITRTGDIVQQATTINLAPRNSGVTVTPTVTFAPGQVSATVTVQAGFDANTFTIDVTDSANNLNSTFFVTVVQQVTLGQTLTAPDGTQYAAGSVIPTDRMTGWEVAHPDTGCSAWHLHALTSQGIFIDGHGPIPDPQPNGCGYGLVIQPPSSPPTIQNFTPSSGKAGDHVTISGTNLSGTSTVVKFNGVQGTVNSGNSTSIDVTVPQGATSGKITVTTTGGTATSSSDFTISSANAPNILDFNPKSGSVGSTVQISGTNLGGTSSVVKFNGVLTPVFSFGPTYIQVTVPVGATTGFITVTTTAGTATSPSVYTVQ